MIIGTLSVKFKLFCGKPSRLRLDHNYLFHPGEFRHELLLQALDQGHARDMSLPAEALRGYLDRAPLRTGKPDHSAAGLVPLILFSDKQFYVLYILMPIQVVHSAIHDLGSSTLL